MSRRPIAFAALAVAGALVPINLALACSSCGCTLNTDGFYGEPGLRVDLRYDFQRQTRLMSGRNPVNQGNIAYPFDQEIQQLTSTKTTNLIVDYSPNIDWGINVQLPYVDRYHTTISNGDTDTSMSHTKSIGDTRVIGRYQGFTDSKNIGIQFGLKLATGGRSNIFVDGPQAGNALDRGLQPGTGTTDLLLGAYAFGALNRNWDYFAQGLVQLPTNGRDEFRPGVGVNLNVGVRYMAWEHIIPQLQINTRVEKRDSGVNADIPNSGATRMYLSPGFTAHIAKDTSLYGFVQLPIYTRVNGYQIESRYTVSVGVRHNF